jgi:rhodanese-related sulfurtransferase
MMLALGVPAGQCPILSDVMSYVSHHGRSRRVLAAAVAVVALTSAGCAGSDQPAASVAPVAEPATESLLAPVAFAEYLDANPDVPVINVHIPYEQHIDGTDAFIPFDSILDSPDLPTDKSAPIALYCRSGNMSAQAAADLLADGYTNVVDLDGGMNAWDAAGNALLDDPAAAGGT